MCLSSVWTQPPYNDKNSLLFFYSLKNLNSLNYQAILILEWITSALFHLQYHDWVETLEQGTEPPTAPRAPQQYVCVHCCVCALGWVKCRAQIPSMGHHIWPHVTSLHFTFTKFVYVWLRKSFYSRLLSEWGTNQGRFCWKVKTQGWISTHCSWSSCTSRSKSHTYFTQYF